MTTRTKPSIYISSDDGQMACNRHRAGYVPIPWRKMTGAEVESKRRELSDKPADEPLCEICARDDRHARYMARRGPATPSLVAAARAEAEVRAHDRVSPDAMLDSIAAVNLYVEAFVAGARFAESRTGASR